MWRPLEPITRAANPCVPLGRAGTVAHALRDRGSTDSVSLALHSTVVRSTKTMHHIPYKPTRVYGKINKAKERVKDERNGKKKRKKKNKTKPRKIWTCPSRACGFPPSLELERGPLATFEVSDDDWCIVHAYAVCGRPMRDVRICIYTHMHICMSLSMHL